MRSKKCLQLLSTKIRGTQPRPEIYARYDGLVGLTKRDMADDIRCFLRDHLNVDMFALVRPRAVPVWVYFDDYVSYGVGGGDATEEMFYGTYLLIPVRPDRPFRGHTEEGVVTVRLPPNPLLATKPVEWARDFLPIPPKEAEP